jgi:ABC-type multidrug transport system fused ATPase/permease subunit
VIVHRLSTIRNADVIIAIKIGRIAERGTYKVLLEKNGLYADLYRRQFREAVPS